MKRILCIVFLASFLFTVAAYAQNERRTRFYLGESDTPQNTIQPPFIELKGEVEQVAFEASKGTGPVNAVAFSPDGKKIFTGSADGYIRTCDAETGKELKKTKRLANSGNPLAVESLTVSPDGEKIVATYRNVRDAIIWDTELGTEMRRLSHSGDKATSISFSPDGKKIATVDLGHSADSTHTAIIWDANSGEKLQTMKGNPVGFSPDGKKIVAGNTIWDAESGKELQKLETKGRMWSFMHVSPDGKKILSCIFGISTVHTATFNLLPLT